MLLFRSVIKSVIFSVLMLVQVGYAQKQEGVRMTREAAEALIRSAIEVDDLACVQKFVEKYGRLPSFHTAAEESWTNVAAAHNAVSILEWLINKMHYNGLECDRFGNTPMHYAAREGALEAYIWLSRFVPYASSSLNDDLESPMGLLPEKYLTSLLQLSKL